MRHVIRGNELSPSQFIEDVAYSDELPYYLCVKRFHADETVVPHYADSVEIVLTKDVRGVLTVDFRSQELTPCGVFFIPPGHVHAIRFYKGNGTAYVLKISPKYFSGFIDLEALLARSGASLRTRPVFLRSGEALLPLFEGLIEHDGNDLICFKLILDVFCFFRDELRAFGTDGLEGDDRRLKALIDFSRENLDHTLSNGDAAAFVGYHEKYFCRWFKSKTNMTFQTYLLRMKMMRAAELLHQGVGVGEAAGKIGYENVGFFAKKFREIYGISPGGFLRARANKEEL